MTEQHDHCWHDTGKALLTNPPQYEDLCCHCGETRTRQVQQVFPEGEHGPYHPWKTLLALSELAPVRVYEGGPQAYIELANMGPDPD